MAKTYTDTDLEPTKYHLSSIISKFQYMSKEKNDCFYFDDSDFEFLKIQIKYLISEIEYDKTYNDLFELAKLRNIEYGLGLKPPEIRELKLNIDSIDETLNFISNLEEIIIRDDKMVLMSSKNYYLLMNKFLSIVPYVTVIGEYARPMKQFYFDYSDIINSKPRFFFMKKNN